MPALFNTPRQPAPGLMELLQTNPHGLGQGKALFEQPSYAQTEEQALQEIMRRARMQEAGFDPDVTIQGSLGQFGKEAMMQGAFAAMPAARMIPRPAWAAAAGLGSYFGMPGMAGAGEEQDRIKDLQMQLRDAGLYGGPIDGVMKPGGPTAAAKVEFDRMQLEQSRVEAERESAAAAKAKADAERLALEQRAKERDEGAARLDELDKGKSDFWDTYGTAAAYGTGFGVGGLMRAGATYLPNKAARKAAEAANKLVSGGGDLPSRASGVNTFWKQGGSPQDPFPPSPKGRYGVKSNRNAGSATTLYPEGSARSKYVRGGDAAAAGLNVAELGYSEVMATGARDELQQAQQAVSVDPSAANVRRLKTAESKLATWEFAVNAGRTALFGYAMAGKFATYKSGRPDVAAAGAERTRIDNLINQRARPIRKRRGP